MSGTGSYAIINIAVVKSNANAGGRPAVRGGPAQQDTVNHVRTER